MALLQPVDTKIKTQAGEERTYVLSKFPAVAGREIIAKYPIAAMPKLGDYNVSEETMLKLMAHVGIYRPDGTVQELTTRALVDNHVPDWETLARIELSMMELNCSFFGDGRALSFFQGIAHKGLAWISETLIPLLEQSSKVEKPPSKS